jgi:hypothetical protein
MEGLDVVRNSRPSCASHSRIALLMIVLKTGWRSVGELAITRRISAVAVCCSSASASRFSASASRFSASARCFSRSRTLEPSFFRDLRLTRSLASTVAFAGFELRRIGPSLTAQRSAPGYAKASAWARTGGPVFVISTSAPASRVN